MFFHFSNLRRAPRLIITGREASVALKWYRENNVKKLCQKQYKYSDLYIIKRWLKCLTDKDLLVFSSLCEVPKRYQPLRHPSDFIIINQWIMWFNKKNLAMAMKEVYK